MDGQGRRSDEQDEQHEDRPQDRPQDRPEIAAAEGSIATEVQYAIRPLDDTGVHAVHFRVRRLFRWGEWEPLRDPTFFTYDAACRYLGQMLHGHSARFYDPVVKKAARE